MKNEQTTELQECRGLYEKFKLCSLPITSSGCNLYSKRLKYLSLYPKSTYSLHVRKNANSSESLLPTV